jgi:ribosomal protein S18 acetylase RimI-like enzyme
MNRLTIRQATARDAGNIARLVNEAYRPRPGAGGWTHESSLVSGERTNARKVEALLSHSVVRVGLRGATIVACVQIEGKGEEAHIGMLAVKPAMQRAGVGDAMLTQAERYAESSLGAEQFVLFVVAARSELIQFYLRRGYEETTQRLPDPVGSGVGTPRDRALDVAVLRKRSGASLEPAGPSAGASRSSA